MMEKVKSNSNPEQTFETQSSLQNNINIALLKSGFLLTKRLRMYLQDDSNIALMKSGFLYAKRFPSSLHERLLVNCRSFQSVKMIIKTIFYIRRLYLPRFRQT